VFLIARIFKLVTHIAIHTEVMEEIVSLENPMALDHPVVRCRNKWLQNSGANISMIVASQGVTNIMK
jgi:hypothetical protein